MWLQCTERRNGILKAKLVMADGSIDWLNLESTWRLDVPIRAKSKLSATTTFAHWKLGNAGAYLNEIGVSVETSAASHQIYTFDHNGLLIVIPAILVLKALFKPSATVFEYLFRPAGLDMLVAPQQTNGSTSVALLHRKIRQHVPIAATSLGRLQWIYCFPSARAAFDSVYRHATQGTFGVRLPNADVEISVQGQLRQNVLIASRLSVTACSPLENPFDWAGHQPEEFRLDACKSWEQLNPVLTDPSILPGTAGWELSDFEWSGIEHFFPSGRRRVGGKRARDFMDAILMKLGTGVGWAKVNSNLGTTCAVSSFYQNLRQSGRWDKVVTAVMATREKSS